MYVLILNDRFKKEILTPTIYPFQSIQGYQYNDPLQEYAVQSLRLGLHITYSNLVNRIV